MKSFASLVLDELELRQIALSDALTGAMTRRGWLAAVEKEMARGARQGTQAAIVLFDVDHFKAINDTHGHAVGDAVLQALTRRCLLHLGPADALGRIGGEEFAVLVPDAGLPEAMELAERLRRSFSDAPIEGGGPGAPGHRQLRGAGPRWRHGQRRKLAGCRGPAALRGEGGRPQPLPRRLTGRGRAFCGPRRRGGKGPSDRLPAALASVRTVMSPRRDRGCARGGGRSASRERHGGTRARNGPHRRSLRYGRSR